MRRAVLVDEAPEASSCVRSSSHDTVHDPRDASNTTPTPQNAKSRLTRIVSGSRASDAPAQAPLRPQRRPPCPQHPRCRRLLPRWFATWAALPRGAPSPTVNCGDCASRGPVRDLPAGDIATKRGNCTIRGATRRRHAEGRLLMLQNPHHYPRRHAPSLVQDCPAGASKRW